MRERQPTNQTMKASEARRQWGSLLNRVFRGETRVIVERSGIPVAAIISPEDFRYLTSLDAERQRDAAILEEFGAAFEDVPVEELEAAVAEAVRQARDKHRHQAAATRAV